MLLPLSSHGATKLIGVGIVAGIYLLYWIIRAIVSHVQKKKRQRQYLMEQYQKYLREHPEHQQQRTVPKR